MNPELERLIDFALADGILTDKEKEILYKKAKELNVDIDEFEMILDGKLHVKQKELKQESDIKATPINPPPLQQQSSKEGDLKKCPACGATVQAFKSKCSDCGHEFRNVQVAKSVKELNKHLQDAANKIRDEKEKIVVTWKNQHLKGADNIAKEIATLQASIIGSFPIPNTKEDILEFLSIAIHEAKKKINTIGMGYNISMDGSDLLQKAWESKCNQIIMKGKLLLKDDPNTLKEIENYEKQFHNEVSTKKRNRILKIVLIPLGIITFFTILFSSLLDSDKVTNDTGSVDSLISVGKLEEARGEALKFTNEATKELALDKVTLFEIDKLIENGKIQEAKSKAQILSGYNKNHTMDRFLKMDIDKLMEERKFVEAKEKAEQINDQWERKELLEKIENIKGN